MTQHRASTLAKWRRIIGSQRDSGQTAAAYCREHGIGRGSFFLWKGLLRDDAAAFVELKPSRAPVIAGGIELLLRGERRLLVHPGFDRDLLIDLVRVLEGIA